MKVLRLCRKIYIKIFGKKAFVFKNQNAPQFQGQDASDVVKKMLEADAPCMIARFGSVELDCINHYKIMNLSSFVRIRKYITGEIDSTNWAEKIKKKMERNAGFFPISNDNLEKFSEMMIDDIKNLDILGSWLHKENNFKEELDGVITVNRMMLEPYFHEEPWSKCLYGKKVLVIHPFVESINKQFKRKHLVFKDQNVLPDFKLITYKPIQSMAGNYKMINYSDWFEALEFMKNDIKNIDFDIAILGCGAYGFPLASFIKDMGRKSIQLGGATQILFGIIGKRWEEEYNISDLITDHWIRPSVDERPHNYKEVEEGCYW